MRSRGAGETIGQSGIAFEGGVNRRADLVYHFYVRKFLSAANIIGLARNTAMKASLDGAAMVCDVEPIADIHAIPVNRQFLAMERTDDEQWDEFFRKLIRSVVVRAVRGRRDQAEGVVISSDEMVR